LSSQPENFVKKSDNFYSPDRVKRCEAMKASVQAALNSPKRDYTSIDRFRPVEKAPSESAEKPPQPDTGTP
jgi:hypothetical protein